MCIVKLDRAATMEGIDGMAYMASDHHVLWQARKSKAAQAETAHSGCLHSQDTGTCKSFRRRFWLPRYLVIPAVESTEAEGLDGPGLPPTKRICDAGAIS